MKDTPLLHFLKNFPPWIVLACLTLVFVSLYWHTKDVSYKEWVALSLASLFTALGVRAAQPQQTAQTEKGDINQIAPDGEKIAAPEPEQTTEIETPVFHREGAQEREEKL